MPFSAFKLKKTYWQKIVWPPTLKGLEEQFVLEDEHTKNKDYWWMPYWPWISLRNIHHGQENTFQQPILAARAGSQLAVRLLHIC